MRLRHVIDAATPPRARGFCAAVYAAVTALRHARAQCADAQRAATRVTYVAALPRSRCYAMRALSSYIRAMRHALRLRHARSSLYRRFDAATLDAAARDAYAMLMP